MVSSGRCGRDGPDGPTGRAEVTEERREVGRPEREGVYLTHNATEVGDGHGRQTILGKE